MPPAASGGSSATAKAEAHLAARARALQEALESLPSNQTKRWAVADGSASGFVTPLRTFRIETGHYCREFLETLSNGQDFTTIQAVACRSDDGRWLVVERDETRES